MFKLKGEMIMEIDTCIATRPTVAAKQVQTS
jgi:hypothetical protein